MNTLRHLVPLLVSLSAAPLSAEDYRTVIFPAGTPSAPLTLEPGGHLDTAATFVDQGMPTRKFLRVVGATVIPGKFPSGSIENRGEENFRQFEYLIDDSLDVVNVAADRYALYFKGNHEEFERKAYHRLSGSLLAPGELTVSVKAKRKGLSAADDAGFGIQLELFLAKEGRDPNDVYDAPDALLSMSIPGGDGPFTEISRTFTLPPNIAAAVVVVGGRRFSGECWVEAPRLTQNGKAVAVIPFEKNAEQRDTFNYWVGCNLVTRNWPVWQVSFAGKTLFEKAVFDRASYVADFFVPLPADLIGAGTLRLTLVSDPVAASFPYQIHSVEILETSARDFEVVHSPEFLARGREFGLLVESNVPNLSLTLSATPSAIPEHPEVRLQAPGLHVLIFRAAAVDAQASVSISDGKRTATVALGQIVEKTDDGVHLSVGDDQYVDKNDPYYAEYFKWYVGQRMGNFYQFRPSYQWSGFRKPEPGLLRHYLGLLQDLRMPYAWQVEGRTLAGKEINPPLEVLDSPWFQGKQAHENDGGYYYWQHFLYKGFFSDMAARNRPFGGIFAKHRPIYTDHGVFIHYDPAAVTDMADGARRLVENLRYSKGESTRHTGPSTLFRYLYQAGYDWVGAEQMYGPEETIMSSLRGASRAYHKENYGTLHAMQWGTGSFTDPNHALRHYLSLAVAYMHGSSHLNTEDGLWLDEHANDRFSESGKAHAAGQHKILDFIETHERRGALATRIAVIQGRNDAWKSFGRTSLWSQNGPKWAFNKACESFDLLKVFYPQNTIDAFGPEGWFTATPHGAVDLVPIEADQTVLRQYQTLIFLGWNTYDRDDFARLTEFVAQGGTLILTAAHLNAELAPDQPPRFPADDAGIKQLLGDDYRQLKQQTLRPLGKGRVVYFPQPVYPIDQTLVKDYTAAMTGAALEANRGQCDRGWIEPGGHIGFTVWDKGARRTLYLLNVDWQNSDESRPAVLLLGASRFAVNARRYALETIHCAEGLAIMPGANTTDVLAITRHANGWHIKIQTTAPDAIRVFNAATGTSQTQQLTTPGTHDLEIN